MTTAADLARAALICLDAKESAVQELARQYARHMSSAYTCADAGLWAESIAHLERALEAARAIMENEETREVSA